MIDIAHKKKIKWKGGSNGYNAQIPRYVADIAELLDTDPDPYFEGVYLTYIFQKFLFDKINEVPRKIISY